jgi:hypothetical protein
MDVVDDNVAKKFPIAFEFGKLGLYTRLNLKGFPCL